MNILVVSQYFWPENFKINDLCSELVRRGHSVTVLTGYPNYPGGSIFPAYKKDPSAFDRLDGAAIVRVPLLPRRHGGLPLVINYLSFALSACLVGHWKLRTSQFDVIFVYEPSPVTVGLPAIVLKWLRKRPIAFWIQDLWPETLDAIGVTKGGWPVRMVGALVRFIYDRCDLILAQSRSFVPQVARRTRHPERIVYFPSWAEPAPEGEVEPAPEVPSRPGVFTVLFAGNVGAAQDFPAVLDAAESLRGRKDIRWVIVGNGRMSQWLEGEVARRGLGDRMLLAGRFPLERMPSFYRHADALLVALQDKPIFAMTIPSKVQSYLQTGIPILSMVNGETANIIDRSGAGIAVPAGDGDALAEAVSRMAAMPAADRAEMGQRGQALAANEFGRGRLIDELEAMLAKLVDARVDE